jgi:hypothetical protein
MSDKSLMNLWASFLANHKLTAERTGNLEVLLSLCKLLAAIEGPKVKPHTARLRSRRLVCLTAMEAGIDLTALKCHGKVAMARGLLDMWNACYQERYGGTYGTARAKEVSRRGVKTKLAERNMEV